MNPLISTWLNYRETPPEFIKIDPVSMTTPDMTMSLQELLERHTQGREVPEFHGTYDDENLDEFFPDLRRLDLVEISELIENNLDHVAQTQFKLQKLQSERFKAQMDEYHAEREKEGAQRTSDPKQQTTEGRQEPAEGGKPQPRGGQQH